MNTWRSLISPTPASVPTAAAAAAHAFAARLAGPLLIAAAAATLTAWTWGRVGDAQIDFGRELYVAERLAAGDVLYRDRAYLYGPLPPYVNAGWWLLFGGGERAVVAGNVVVLGAVCVLLYRVLALVSDRFAATLAAVLFLAHAGLAATTRITNYNFLTPYAHGMTHGLALGLGAVAASARLYRARTPGWAGLLGLLVGLAALTKPEILLAVAAAAAAGMAVVLRDIDRGYRAGLAVPFVSAAALPPLVAIGLLWAAMPLPMAVDGVLGGWQHVGAPYVSKTPFYTHGLGLEFPRRNAEKVLRYACLYGQFVLPLGLAAVALRRWPRASVAVGAVAAVGVFALTQLYPFRDKFWLDVGRGLPVFPLVGAAVGLAMVWRRARTTPRGVATLALAVLGGAMLLKMGMNAKLFHYGFVLAAPAVGLGVAIAAGWVPQVVACTGASAALVRLGVAGAVLGVAARQLSTSAGVLAERTVPFGSRDGLLVTTADKSSVVEAADLVRRSAAPGETLAVFPDASGLNYVTGLANPTPYDILHPMALAMYGDDAILAAYRAAPPDHVVLITGQDTWEFGGDRFGGDYAEGFVDFLADYDRIATFGGEGGRGGRVAVEVYRRRDG